MTKLPSMIVFDLDDCLWTPEMHELPVHGELNPNYNSMSRNRNGKHKQQKGIVGLQVLRYRDTVTIV
jgi:hypothetical protein